MALIYVWNTLGGPNQATIGMQMMGIRLERLDGGRVDGLLAVVHSVLFWAGNVVLTPLILLATLLLDRKRTRARPAARHGGRRAPTADASSSAAATLGKIIGLERPIMTLTIRVDIFRDTAKV